jgi:hypothetical protein
LSHLDFDIVSDFEFMGNMSINYPTLAHFRHFSSLYTNLRSTLVENIRQITPFYAKQTQFQKWQKNINTYLTMRYENLDTLMGQKTKPKQTQFKPIQTQFKPNKANNKANSNPILRPKEIEQKADTECLKQRVYGSCNLKQFFIS